MTATLQERLTNKVVADLAEMQERETQERWQRRRALALLVLNSEDQPEAEQPDVERVADELRAIGWDNEALFVEVDRLRKCRELAAEAKQLPAVQAELQQVAADIKATDEELGRLVREYKEKLLNLSQRQAALIDKQGRALRAQGDLPNLMQLSPDIVRREREIAEECVRLGEIETELRDKLRLSRPYWLNSTLAVDPQAYPNLAIAECKSTLKDADASPANKKRAKAILGNAEAAKKQIEERLQQVERRRGKLLDESRKYHDLKMQGV